MILVDGVVLDVGGFYHGGLEGHEWGKGSLRKHLIKLEQYQLG